MSKRSKRRQIAAENIKNLGVKILWEDFVWVLTKLYKAKMFNKPGSCRVFVIEGVYPFNAHEPHGREPWVSKEDRKRAKWAIEAAEALQDDEDGEEKKSE